MVNATGTPVPIVVVRSAMVQDSHLIFTWRNDVDTREQSHHREPLSWEQHCRWFENTLPSKQHCLLLCDLVSTGVAVAMVRFDVSDDRALVSLNLAPDQRGLRLAKPCLQAAIPFFLNQYREVHALTAEIKMTNRASCKVFEGTGFQMVSEMDGIGHYQWIASL